MFKVQDSQRINAHDHYNWLVALKTLSSKAQSSTYDPSLSSML